MRRLLLLGLSVLAVPLCIAGCEPEEEKEDESPDSITVGPANPGVVVGSSVQLTATAHYADGSTDDITDVATWTSNTGAIASVTDGLVTTLTTGDVLITASYDLRSASALVAVLVPPPAPGFVEVEPNDDSASANDIGTELSFSGSCTDTEPVVEDFFSAVLGSGDYLVTLTWEEGPDPYQDLDLILLDANDELLGVDDAVPPDDSPAEAIATLTTDSTLVILPYCFAFTGTVSYQGTISPQ